MGDDIPSESTFSRSFTEFASSKLANLAHDALVKEYLADELLGHVSRDSTAIIGREKPAKKVKESKKPRKRGRPAKGEQPEPVAKKRLDRQVNLSAAEAILDLPTCCDPPRYQEKCQGLQNVLERLQAAFGYKRCGNANQRPCHLGLGA